MKKLPLSFYQNPDTVQVAKDLLGKELFTKTEVGITSGIITETEAYCGVTDRACHAYGNRRTARTEIMFQKGGVAYVYLCYGMHYLFNVVTNIEGNPHAVLIRSITVKQGQKIIQQRTRKDAIVFNGPGKLTKALGINKELNMRSLTGDSIWIEETYLKPEIIVSSRIGVNYAGEDALLPYRFSIDRRFSSID